MSTLTHLRDNAEFSARGVVAITAALPIALMFGDGWKSGIGVVYTIAWVVVIAPTTFVYLLFLMDSWLLLMHKRPLVLPTLMLRSALGLNTERPYVSKVAERFSEISLFVNPITNLVFTLFGLSLRWRREAVVRLSMEARERAAMIKQDAIPRRRDPDMAVEFATPMIRPIHDELLCV
jgi:hypothetical protein